MSKANELVAALRKQGKSGGVTSVREHWERQKLIWIAYLSALRDHMNRWLAPVVDAGLAKIEGMDFSIEEPDLGHYMAPGSTIELLIDEPKAILVRPRGARIVGLVEDSGRRVIGASGRVDLEWGVNRQILLRFGIADDARWYSFADGAKRQLNEELFIELLARTAEVDL
jgi:hypothetical protein